MSSSKKSRPAAVLTAAVVVATAGVCVQTGAFAAPSVTGASGQVATLTGDAPLVAEFEDGIVAKVSGGTVIPVTVTGGTVGATAQQFSVARVTARIGGLAAPVTWVDGTHLKVTAPVTTKGTTATMQLLRNGVAGAESTSKVAYLSSVSTVSPAKISSAGGTPVTITGMGFLGVDEGGPGSVTFGGAAATSFTVVSATRITAIAPAGTSGAAVVTVKSAGGESLSTTATRTTYRTALGISTAAEVVAKASGGPLVLTVTGGTVGANAKEFVAERISVMLGRTPLSAVYQDATHIKVTVPATAADSAELTVMHDTIAGEAATLTLAPVVTSLSAKSDTVVGGAKVTVRVAGANIAGATNFKFGDEAATCIPQGTGVGTSFVCVVPPAPAVGPVWISFTSGTGTASRFTAASTFSYTS